MLVSFAQTIFDSFAILVSLSLELMQYFFHRSLLKISVLPQNKAVEPVMVTVVDHSTGNQMAKAPLVLALSMSRLE